MALEIRLEMLLWKILKQEGGGSKMELGQWAGLAILVAMCFGLIVWIVYVMKKDKKGKE